MGAGVGVGAGVAVVESGDREGWDGVMEGSIEGETVNDGESDPELVPVPVAELE